MLGDTSRAVYDKYWQRTNSRTGDTIYTYCLVSKGLLLAMVYWYRLGVRNNMHENGKRTWPKRTSGREARGTISETVVATITPPLCHDHGIGVKLRHTHDGVRAASNSVENLGRWIASGVFSCILSNCERQVDGFLNGCFLSPTKLAHFSCDTKHVVSTKWLPNPSWRQTWCFLIWRWYEYLNSLSKWGFSCSLNGRISSSDYVDLLSLEWSAYLEHVVWSLSKQCLFGVCSLIQS